MLKQRLSERAGKNGPNNLPVSEAEIEMYWRGFERPVAERHIKIDGTADFDPEEFLKMV
ncbi:MAG: hypothetical protein IKL18_06855 [Oscillospiraceae bacterium]|nr:hypothetical protein [Oscillospiraceae bacterium]MBR6657871.1 hypothetical protein [Oscillospiraceae bacterium]